MTPAREDNASFGVFLMTFAILLWVLHDAISKWLLQDHSILQILLLRTVFSLIPILIVVRREGGYGRLREARVWACLGRGCLAVCCFSMFLAALPLMPLTDIFAIVMSAPLLITAFAALLLKEPVGPRRWAAIAVGFGAVLGMMRPGGNITPLGALFVVGSVVTYSISMVLTRWIGTTESAGAMTFYSALVFLGVSAVGAPFVWTRPEPSGWLLMAATGLLAGAAQYCMTEAFRIAPPSVVAPFEYTSLVWAMLFGYLVWGEVPTALVLFCSAVVIASGIYVLHDEKGLQRRRRAQLDAAIAPPGS